MTSEFRDSRRADEASTLRDLERFLGAQGRLDRGDVESVRNFLRRYQQALTADWTRIVNGLLAIGETSLAEDLRQRSFPAVDPADLAMNLRRELPAEPRIAFLIGAGGSKASPTEIPTVDELLPVLWSKAAEINAPALTRLQSTCADLQIEDIETLLTAIDLAQTASLYPGVAQLMRSLLFRGDPISRNRFGTPNSSDDVSAVEVVESIRESSQTLFSILVGMMTGRPINPMHESVAAIVRQHQDVKIITTNYDTCLESAVSASGGQYRYSLGGGLGALILKLHGSLNWYACRNCDRHITATLEQIAQATAAGLYPVISMCPSCSASAPQLIVPPVSTKTAEHPFLLDIRQEAEEALQNADLIVTVGYSFKSTDRTSNGCSVGRSIDRTGSRS